MKKKSNITFKDIFDSFQTNKKFKYKEYTSFISISEKEKTILMQNADAKIYLYLSNIDKSIHFDVSLLPSAPKDLCYNIFTHGEYNLCDPINILDYYCIDDINMYDVLLNLYNNRNNVYRFEPYDESPIKYNFSIFKSIDPGVYKLTSNYLLRTATITIVSKPILYEIEINHVEGNLNKFERYLYIRINSNKDDDSIISIECNIYNIHCEKDIIEVPDTIKYHYDKDISLNDFFNTLNETKTDAMSLLNLLNIFIGKYKNYNGI